MKIVLNSGREIALERLEQWWTYAGVLAGLPTRRRNGEKIDETLAKARKQCVGKAEPFLIHPRLEAIRPVRPPSRALLEKTGTTAAQYAEYMASRHHERMPAIACIGVFDSGELARPGSEPYSSLTVVWYQDEFAPPIDDDVLDQIRMIDWEAVAADWNW